VPEPFLEKLWRMLQCRDLSLSRAHQSVGQHLSRLSEKEQEIQRMASDLSEKEDEIQRMASALTEKEDEICQLAQAASERLELVNRQYAELEAIRRSGEYRLGYLALNPWQVLKKRLFGNTSFR